jgi:hypothetical protein
MIEPVGVRLTYGQLSMAAHVAVMRNASNILKEIAPKHGASNAEGSWEMNINSCCAELAVARYTNRFWCGTFNNFKARDVGGLVDVRSRSREDYDLILYRDDPDDVPFVHVWSHSPDFTLWGWMFASDGKKEEYWSDPSGKNRPNFFVPRRAQLLRPMSELLDWLKECDREGLV